MKLLARKCVWCASVFFHILIAVSKLGVLRGWGGSTEVSPTSLRACTCPQTAQAGSSG